MRQIRPYHFSRFRSAGFSSFYNRVKDSHGILCLDFEDSIGDPDSEASRKSKQIQRAAVVDLLRSLNLDSEEERIGIRVNSIYSEYFQEDIEAINSLRHLHSIFLPKVESPEAVLRLAHCLEANVNEIIPVIETEKGLNGIENILSFSNSSFKAVAFGHCDFNLSKNCFPFFHQDSDKYWEWISLVDRMAAEAGKKLINSPVLRLDDRELFLWTLRKILEYPSIEGQATLCLKQTEWCSQSELETSDELGKWKMARVPDFDIAISIVEKFENHRLERRMFAVDNDRTVISPQEYLAARKYLGKFHEGKNILIVGGCLPIQYNIPRDDLYHHTLANLLEKRSLKANVAIIRYETLSGCLGKIIAAAKNVHVDILMFNLRTEPLMRISKVFYKYVDEEGKLRRSLNFPFLKKLNAEKYDPLAVRILDTSNKPRKKESKWRRFLIESNCFFGTMIGNEKYAIERYRELLISISKFCGERDMKLLLLGPATRPFSLFENKLAKDINEKFSKIAKDESIPYVDAMGTHDHFGNYLFFENGIHVSQAGHDRIGKLIFEKMVEQVL